MCAWAPGPPGFMQGADHGLRTSPLMSSFMPPCSQPPWSLLVGVDMEKGDILWSRHLGVIDKLAPGGAMPLPLEFGTPAAGGAIVTGGGVAFIGASYDERFRGFDVDTGKILWEVDIPFSANATPMTYKRNGKQYVVVSAGGHAWSPLPKGDFILAFALPD